MSGKKGRAAKAKAETKPKLSVPDSVRPERAEAGKSYRVYWRSGLVSIHSGLEIARCAAWYAANVVSLREA